jgi:hypothetical protein
VVVEHVRIGVGDHGEVELAAGQQPERRVRPALGQAQLDLGVGLRERGDRQRRQRRARGRERSEAQPAGVQARERLKLRLGGRQAAEDHLRVLHQQLAGGRQADAAGRAVDQPGAGLGLERGDLARHGGLGEGERVGGGGEAPARRDFTQHA